MLRCDLVKLEPLESTSLAPQTQFQVLRTNNYYTRVSPLAIISCVGHVRILLFYSTISSYLLVFYQRSKVAASKK